MSYTLKIVSRRLDSTGYPAKQVWFPGVTMISRIAERPLQDVMDGCWQLYGQIEMDFVTPSIGESVLADRVKVGQLITRGSGSEASAWRVAGTEHPDPDTVRFNLISVEGDAGQFNDYARDSYVTLWNDDMGMIKFNASATLLWVNVGDQAMHMIVERAFLLGPTGGTVDRITGSGY